MALIYWSIFWAVLYYDASANGDKLIGWHLNNGKDKTPDFYPAKILRKKFYRPQIISQILTTLDEAKAIRLANQLGEKTDAKHCHQITADCENPQLPRWRHV